MARIVTFTATAPFKLEPQPRSVWLCQCGLSQNKPFCDGSHALTQTETPHSICEYSQVTQKRIRCTLPPEPGIQESDTTIVLRESDDLSLVHFDRNSALFEEVCRIRSSASESDDSPNDRYDENADLYLLKFRDDFIATMRVNLARRGLLDCQEYYPQDFLADYSDWIGSASRLARDRKASACPDRVKWFIREVWRHQFRAGLRLDLINCHQRMENFYVHLGYRRIEGYNFVHPRLSTPSFVMLLAANSDIESPIQDVFASEEARLARVQDFTADLFKNPGVSRSMAIQSQ